MKAFFEAMKRLEFLAELQQQEKYDKEMGFPGHKITHVWPAYEPAMDAFASNVASLKCIKEASGKGEIRFVDDQHDNALAGEHLRSAALGIVVDALLNRGIRISVKGEDEEDVEMKTLAKTIAALGTALRLEGWDWRDSLQFIRAVSIGFDHKLDKDMETIAKCFYDNGSAAGLDALFGSERAALLSVCLKRS